MIMGSQMRSWQSLQNRQVFCFRLSRDLISWKSGKRLSALNGTVFDVEYTRAQVTEHQKTVQLLLWVIASGENADLQRFASGTLPD